VQIQRHLQLLGTGQDRPEELVVQVAAAAVAVDQGALEAVGADRALQLVGGGLGIRGRERGEPGQPVWMAAHRLGEGVVGGAGEGHRLGRVELLHPWSGQRQDLEVETGGVHVGDPALADVAQLLDESGKARRHLRVGAGCLGLLLDLAPWTVHERRGRVVLLQGNRAHGHLLTAEPRSAVRPSRQLL